MKESELKYRDREIVYNIKENRFLIVLIMVIGFDNELIYGLFEYKTNTFNHGGGFTNYHPINLDDVISKSEYRCRIIQDLL